MNLAELLEYLRKHAREFSFEHRIRADGKQVYILQVPLPEFPFGPNRYRWYPLVVENDQEQIPRQEIEALLRHFWHYELDPLGDYPDLKGD